MLPAFAAEHACSSCPAGAQQQTYPLPLLLSIDGTDRQMHSWTLNPYIDLTEHTVQAASLSIYFVDRNYLL